MLFLGSVVRFCVSSVARLVNAGCQFNIESPVVRGNFVYSMFFDCCVKSRGHSLRLVFHRLGLEREAVGLLREVSKCFLPI